MAREQATEAQAPADRRMDGPHGAVHLRGSHHSGTLLGAGFGQDAIQRAGVPEVLDLQACGLTRELARERIEGEVVLCRCSAAAIKREGLALREFLEIRPDVTRLRSRQV